jgi:hypothetical protein
MLKTSNDSRGCLTALSWFVCRLGELGLPLYKLLKKSDSFCWMEEMQKELNELKALISKLPVLASLELGKTLLYVAVTIHVINTTLVVEREEPGQVYKV